MRAHVLEDIGMKKAMKGIALASLVLVVSSSLALGGCKKKDKDDDTTLLLLLYLADQLSGNCSQAVKSATATTYTVTGSGIPKGGCNEATLVGTITTDAATAVEKIKAGYNEEIAVFGQHSSVCSAVAGTSAGTRDAVTTTTVSNASAAATPKCAAGAKGSVVHCTDDAAVTSYRNLRQYFVVGDVSTDMASSLAGQKANATTNKGVTKFTDAAIAAIRARNKDESATLSGPEGRSFLTAIGTSACALAIANANSAVKNVYVAAFGDQVLAATGVSGASATEVVLTSLQCVYGTGATETATVKNCNATYTQF